ncbi:hypothetical protein HJC23_007710 [Cyclotella cryptica]|uniref:Uncharacterized protein n=1 Tax=Cyclotella cryptica TaxID=29204 RepID=A0ABD3PBI1_9STRA|eukprot:CCRYP_016377-RA/>CCRYP_016377-RA protein AED:0.07 eAED:0.07 QI:387/1/1/1/0.5/0.33/3/849/111
MFSSRFVKLVLENKNAWVGGLAVVVLGTSFKVTYFNFSRGLLVDHMERRHLAATEHLKDARQFAQTKAKERENRLPPLTEEQREQLREYLRLLAEREPEVYPNPKNFRPRN